MKLLFSTLFVAVMAASLQAVTVAWTLQNSYWINAQADAGTEDAKISDWTGFTKPGAEVGGINYNGVNLDVYVFFSTVNYDAENAAKAAATAGTPATYDMASATSTTNSTLNVYKSGLNPEGTTGGFYYMVIFEGNNTSAENYAVAKTTQITGTADNKQGVYDLTVDGTPPDTMEYVQLDWMAGSTWGAPKMTPEPTALALLALGVAGLALRRKNA